MPPSRGPIAVGGLRQVEVELAAPQCAKITPRRANCQRCQGHPIAPEPEILHPSPQGTYFELELNQPDYMSAAKIADAINADFPGMAMAMDEKIVKVLFPSSRKTSDLWIIWPALKPLTFQPDNRAKILVNEKSGTIVATEKVTIAPCAISIGGLTISVASNQG